ncbi:hypothetical protein SAMN05720764_101392 [Fibrobacter sp. UWH5]|uniref:hypothetical protein n=1 Tax=Fibrobacter sp. UWH5 TaxID=1896211 RepID=UPI00091E2D6C|nr:hypothetical protein [Fibrobacter sp. UWH5]SHK42385.1 hypothetical protein SAMN05720764_101392 [Fibrobacter sp. UWH5]
MARYLIKDVKCGVVDGGVGPCGPGPSVVVAEVELQSEAGGALFLSLAECDGIPNMYKTSASTYDKHFEDTIDEAFFEELNANGYVDGLGCSYEEFFEETDHEFYQEFRYLIYIVRSDWDEIDRFKAETVGKWLGDFDIPKSDVEEDWEYEKECDDAEPEPEPDYASMKPAEAFEAMVGHFISDSNRCPFAKENGGSCDRQAKAFDGSTETCTSMLKCHLLYKRYKEFSEN